ncbi:PTS system beta-glucoside-specific EIIBCA component [Clostridium puniceum]|uniref:PTS system beta-glucoside-specific EIIBCA component n=1 Tax=Clostridium puniceum TaxID=29367 RepID=A0A1S8TAY3_9CLOT|nr:beta-glucoside-specific PTS transporter subunit IIABC [Clostridium puniceum]OOM74950.1 PTS system beta-glucoside-specific EIIBCA component [Clostridium puniceum]
MKELASNIIKNIGSKENIKEMFHCVTRLRFYLKDKNKVNLDEIKKINGVIGAQYQTDQLQIIIGNKVQEVYDEITRQAGFIHDEKSVEKKEKFKVTGIFEILAGIFLPVIPALAGTGMLKGVIILLTTYCGVDAKSETMQVMNIASDCVFYFLPFLVAWSAAKKFSTNIPLAMALAGCLLYPTMTDGLAQKLYGISFLGLPVPFVKYAASSIPIILSVWALSYVYPFVEKCIPKVLRLVFTPMLVILIMAPATLIAFGPLANYISKGLAEIVKFLFDVSPILAGAVIGSTRPIVVLTGMHLSLGAIILQNIATYGYDTILPINTMGTLAIAGASFGTWYKAKNTANKSVAMSAGISGIIGITEPGIYGVLLKFKNSLIATMIAGGVAGAFVAFFKGHSSAYVNSSLLSLPVFAGPGLVYVCIGMAMSFTIAFVLVNIFGLSEEKNQMEADKNTEVQVKEGTKVALNKSNEIKIYSPMNGDLIEISKIEDKVFASGSMGKGIAINPIDGKVYAPFDGEITAAFPTKHAIGITSKDGVECLIHVGLDTVNLKGKYFDLKVEEKQSIKTGDLILEFDHDSITKEGYSLTTSVIITNSDDYLDVLPNELSGIIAKQEPLMTVLK